MRSKLRLVKSSRPPRAEMKREVRYRFPAEEQVSEVSCDGRMPRERAVRPARTETRRAS